MLCCPDVCSRLPLNTPLRLPCFTQCNSLYHPSYLSSNTPYHIISYHTHQHTVLPLLLPSPPTNRPTTDGRKKSSCSPNSKQRTRPSSTAISIGGSSLRYGPLGYRLLTHPLTLQHSLVHSPPHPLSPSTTTCLISLILFLHLDRSGEICPRILCPMRQRL